MINTLKSTGETRARVVVVAALLLILYTTLFPFDFLFFKPATHFDLALIKADALNDYPRNILLFMPFGFGAAALLRNRPGRLRRAAAGVLLSSLSLSAMVETLQLFVSARDPSLADIVANSAGALLGALIFYRWGESILSYPVFGKIHLSARWLMIAITGHLAFMALNYALLANTAGLDNWSSSFPLIIGNEQTGDRPWQGVISNLQIADRALAQPQITHIFSGQPLANPLAVYPLNASSKLADQSGRQPPLQRQGAASTGNFEGEILLGPDYWLQTGAPVTALSQKLADSAQFTFSFVAAAASSNQTGPARLISISGGPFDRNLTIAQDGADLIIRLRTPATGANGAAPELAVPGVFANSQPHHLVIVYDGATLRIYIDGPEQVYAFRLAPHITFFRYLLPVDAWRIRLNSIFLPVYGVIFYALIFIPAGFLLYTMDKRRRQQHSSFLPLTLMINRR